MCSLSHCWFGQGPTAISVKPNITLGHVGVGYSDKRMRVVITHLKKTRRRRVRVERKVRARRSHTLFLPFENLFSVSGGVYIERIFLERV